MNVYQKILKKAKRSIANGDHSYVCWAIEDASWHDTDRNINMAGERIMNYIEDCLGKHPTLVQFLWWEAKVHESELTDENVKAYRLRYIDHLMEVFENVK